MAKNQDVFFTKVPQVTAVKFLNADGATDVDGSTNTKTICTAGSDDTIVKAIAITSSDSANRDVILFLNGSGTSYCIGIINVPLTSGFASSIAAVNGLGLTPCPWLQSDKDGNKFITLKTGWTLKAGMKVAVTAATTLTISVLSEDFS